MSTKTKQRLSQLLFRRSNTSNNTSSSSLAAPSPSANSSSSHHKPQVMGCGNNKNTHEALSKDSHHHLLVSSSFIKTTEGDDHDNDKDNNQSHRLANKLVAFSDKHLIRARSSSPNKQQRSLLSNDSNNKPPSILKNGQSPQNKNNRGRRNVALGKATLQRTKSNPIPQLNTKTSPSVADANNNNATDACESSSSTAATATPSSHNPLLDLSWNCPTLEKRKELILSYFKTYVLDPEGKQSSQSDPIYEEINDNTRNQKLEDANNNNLSVINKPSSNANNTDSLKPKLLPKKVRLNLPLTQLEPNNNNTDQNYPPIYDKLRPTRAASFNIYDTLRKPNKGTSSCKSTDDDMTVKSVVKIESSSKGTTGETAESKSKSRPANASTNDNLAGGGGVGLAHFASEVAQHATSRRANRSNSFTPSSSLSCLNELKSPSYCPSSQSGAVDIMDQIYSQLTKRSKKVNGSSVTSRLLKRHNNNHLYNNHHELKDDDDESTTSLLLHQATEHKHTTIKNDDEVRRLSSEGGLSKEEANSKRTINVGGNYNKNNEEQGSSYDECCTSTSAEEDESESQKVEKSCANLASLPVRPLRKGRPIAPSQSTQSNAISNSNNIHNHPCNIPTKEKELPEKDLSKALMLNSPSSYHQNHHQTGFINLADVFPPISVIDSTSPQPRAYPLSQFNSSKDSSSPKNSDSISCYSQSYTTTNKDIDRNRNSKDIGASGVFLANKTSVKVKEDQFNISTESHLLLHKNTSGTDDSLSSHHQPNNNTQRDNRNDSSSIMDPQPDQETSLTEEQVKSEHTQGVVVDSDPLILWEDQKSPQESSYLLLGDSSSETSTTSDLYLSDSVSNSSSSSGGSNCGGDESSIITIIRTISPPPSDQTSDPDGTPSAQVIMTSTMNDSNNDQLRNQFIRQESKHNSNYFDDEDVDGGFESFQVVGNEYDDDQDDGVVDGPFSPPSSSGSPDNMNQMNRPRTFAQNQQNIPTTELASKASSVLDLINAEISDLHLRELELKKKNRVADGKEIISEDLQDHDLLLGEAERTSQADSDEYTDSAVDIAESYSRTSTTSSGNVTPNDGARIDGRDLSPEKGGQDDEIFESGTSNKIEEEPTKQSVQQQQGSVNKVRPIVEEEVKSIALNITKETPIEREIRLVREREEEFRRSRGVSVSDNNSSPVSSTEKVSSPSPPMNNDEEEVKVAAAVTSAVTVVSGSSGSNKDIQYEMAAARLKREIEEGLKRERELYEEGRLKTLRTDEVKDGSQEGGEPSSQGGGSFTPFKTLVKIPKKPSVPKGDSSVDPLSVPFGGVPTSAASNNNGAPSSGKTGFSFGPAPTTTTTTMTSLSIPSQEPPQLQLQPQSPQQSQSLPMNKISKPQFTSIERMILKGSFSFNRSMSEEDKRSLQMEETTRMNNIKIARMPDPLQIVQRVESIEEIEEGASQTETDSIKPRRKYVTAQDKIQIELQEQVKREKELSQLRAKWKSTPDLSKMDEESDVNKDDGSPDQVLDGIEGGDADDEYLPTKPSALRRQRQLSQSTQKIDDVTTSDVLKLNKPTVRRRQSALINQWEEMIKQQQEKNKN